VLFDLDGTLYRQGLLQTMMAVELLALVARNPFSAPRRLHALKEYRQAQEALRHRSSEGSGPGDQIAMAAARSGTSPAELASLVDEWMMQRPLKYLAWCRAPGVDGLLEFLEEKGLEIGVLSDYPSAAKLRALGLSGRFPLALCSSDAEIGVFKPNPRGFLLACGRWGLSPDQVLMVGDRIDVDAAGASAAGMPCVIIGKPSLTLERPNLMVLASLERLHRVLDDSR